MILDDSDIKAPIKTEYEVPLVVRGEVITDYSKTFGERHGSAQFVTPDAKKYLRKIVLQNPARLKDLYDVSISEILEFLHDLGQRCILSENEYLQEAFALNRSASGLTDSVLTTTYNAIPTFLDKVNLAEMLDKRIGINYLERWVPTTMNDGRTVSIRAFGAKTCHITAGNVPLVAVGSLARSCGTRCDTIIKSPSNDPLTATALAQTMIDMEPNHPITKHVTVVYWKGGNAEFESAFYQPQNVEKIIAWGGYASVKHISKYMQPGIDLITLDPKLSMSIIGREAFSNDQTLQTAAQRAAIDVGSLNQEACVNSRVIYVHSETDDQGIINVNKLGQYLYEALVNLPSHISTPAKHFDLNLKAKIDGIRMDGEFYQVFGGQNNEGAVIVSQLDEPVDFSPDLCGRVVNLVPVDDLQTVVQSVNAYTQTVGIYPEKLKLAIRNDLIRSGVQRIVSLGFAAQFGFATPQDAIEPLRRMCKWVMDEVSVND